MHAENMTSCFVGYIADIIYVIHWFVLTTCISQISKKHSAVRRGRVKQL